MKIFHVVHGFPPEVTGGTERTAGALGRAMRESGHEVAIVAGSLERAPSDRVDEREHAGLRVLRIHRDDLHFEDWFKAWSPDVSARFSELLEREKPDVVHVHHWIRLTSDLVRRAGDAGCIVAVTLHDYYSVLASPVRTFGVDEARAPDGPDYVGPAEVDDAFAFHRRDMIDEVRAAQLRFAPSRAHAVGVQELADAPLGPILTAAPPLLRVPARRTLGGARGRRLLYWGSIYPEKGIEVVLDALFSIGGGWELTVLGEAPDPGYREMLERRCERMPVTFRGAFDGDDLDTSPADYAVLPSICQESYGLTLDEAHCLGLPVIASDLPAYRERAQPDASAFFAPGDAGALAALLLDEDRLNALQAPASPNIASAASAAGRLLAEYGRARAGEHGPYVAERLVSERDRAGYMFRRAERRLWTALQQPDPPAPPD